MLNGYWLLEHRDCRKNVWVFLGSKVTQNKSEWYFVFFCVLERKYLILKVLFSTILPNSKRSRPI